MAGLALVVWALLAWRLAASTTVAAAGVIAAALLVVFVRHERRLGPAALAPLGIFRPGGYTAASCAMAPDAIVAAILVANAVAWSPLSAAAMAAVSAADAGAASGMFNMVRQVAAVAGVAVIGALLTGLGETGHVPTQLDELPCLSGSCRSSSETGHQASRTVMGPGSFHDKPVGGASSVWLAIPFLKTIRRLIDEHWRANAVPAVHRYRESDPARWSDYIAEAEETSGADAPITDEWTVSSG
ncbi:MAG: hypothetical protein M3017_02085 [Actinomycetota bacterium]|nr:hypothetical protein [Actinomycetota bacterium]